MILQMVLLPVPALPLKKGMTCHSSLSPISYKSRPIITNTQSFTAAGSSWSSRIRQKLGVGMLRQSRVGACTMADTKNDPSSSCMRLPLSSSTENVGSMLSTPANSSYPMADTK